MKPALLIGAAGVALTGLAGYNVLYVPQKAQVRLIRGQIQQEQASQATQAEVGALLDDIAQHRIHLSQEPDSSQLAHRVLALAKKTGVELSTISHEPPQKLDQFTRLAVTMQFTGSYHQLGTLVDLIERSEHYMRIERVNVSRSTEEGRASIQLTVSTLFVLPIAPSASTPSS
jgi:Tfp pilus assembly protein PilO